MCKTNNRVISIISAVLMFIVCLMTFPARLSGNTVGGAEMDVETAAETMAARFNEEREKLGLEPMYIVPYLNDLAAIRAKDITEVFDHVRPDGSGVDDLIDVDIVDYNRAAEVLARGSFDIDAILNAWKNSKNHWNYITRPEATHIGIAVYYDPESEYKWYWAAIMVNMDRGSYLPEQRSPLEDAVVPKYCGDLNGDGQIDSFDLVLLNKYLSNNVYFNEAQIKAADILSDGVITSADASVLRKYILGEYSQLPVTIDMLFK